MWSLFYYYEVDYGLEPLVPGTRPFLSTGNCSKVTERPRAGSAYSPQPAIPMATYLSPIRAPNTVQNPDLDLAQFPVLSSTASSNTVHMDTINEENDIPDATISAQPPPPVRVKRGRLSPSSDSDSSLNRSGRQPHVPLSLRRRSERIKKKRKI